MIGNIYTDGFRIYKVLEKLGSKKYICNVYQISLEKFSGIMSLKEEEFLDLRKLTEIEKELL